jgi:DNA-directed RNA polymerase specialized sigma24 family protein
MEAVVSNAPSLGDVVTARSSAAKQIAHTPQHELLASISAGSRSAMEEFYLLYFTRLAHFFTHMTANADLVEELISDTMFDVWRQSATIGSNVSVPIWIMRLAYSHGQVRLARTGLACWYLPTPTPHTKHGIAPAATSQISVDQQDLLMELPFEERAVLHLIYAGGHSRQSIADIMSMSCEELDILLAQARYRLCCTGKIDWQQPCSPEP